MELQIENIIAAYNTADDNGKNLLRTMFPNVEFGRDKQAEKRPITERIKTFEDACQELGEEHPFVVAYRAVEDIDECSGDIEAYLQLRIIVAALNEGWTPELKEDATLYHPWHWLYTQDEIDNMDEDERKERRMMQTGDYATGFAGFGCADSAGAPLDADVYVGSRLCLKSRELAVYCGKQFIGIWADFRLIRK